MLNTSMVEPGSRVPFPQPGIGVEKREEFQQLHSVLERIFGAWAVEGYLRLLQRKGVSIRDFDRVLREKLLEQTDHELGKSGGSAKHRYDTLSVGDQAQVREFYLTALEAVDLPLREKFKKLYRHD